MKNSLRNSKLWQQKRNELKVNTDANQDWADMHNLLDQHLPVSPKGNLPGSGASGMAKLGGMAGISAAIIGITVYLVAHFGSDKVDKMRRDSINNKQQTELVTPKASPNTTADSAINYSDAANSTKGNASLPDSGSTIKTGTGTTAAPNPVAANPSAIKVGGANGSTTKPASGNTPNLKGGNNSAPKNGSNASAPNVRSNTAFANVKGNLPASKPGKGGPLLANNGRGGSTSGRLTNNSRGVVPNNHGRQNISPSRPNNGPGRNDRQTQPQTKSGVKDLTRQGNGKSPRETIANADKSKADVNKEQLAEKSPTDKGRDSIKRENNVVEQLALLKHPATLASHLIENKAKVESQAKTKDKMPRPERAPSTGASKFDYGILGGANASDSFGLYGGAYGAYHFNNKWGVNLQVLGLNAQNISGGYSHANGSKVDSGKIIQVTDSRKAYFVTVPLHVTYNITDNFSVKAGPVLSIPVKQANGVTSLTPTTISKDTVYYRKTIGQINATKYDQQINIGVSGGVRYQYNRFSIEATYIKSLSGFNVTSDYGTYKTNGSGMLNITIGVQLNRVKKVQLNKPQG